MSDKREVEFEIEKETKNTIRFKEIEGDTPSVIKTVYVQKETFGGGDTPKKIKITLEWDMAQRE
ncbi:MAG: hypothetical protein EF807_01530 [Candidatus Methanolliviera hydrocarbonicum]|uniref:Uncharacterized protein n=1 Tax=Candidatus Methanolliviera hydrocarbonicum TaxID=2491085 RepID=A0A520KYJ8_9EURY|nr:MAG: hypothetical protein EF807_01530 [Candidatus Methanolliviera hydrocarbonicum]